MKQRIYHNYQSLLKIISAKNPLVVCKNSAQNTYIYHDLKKKYPHLVIFNEYSSNPLYEEVLKGIKKFKDNNCDFLISIGGGSAIDVAKTIKAFLKLDPNENYLNQKIIKSQIKHLSVPTTAGTGSESTSFAVIYYQNTKKSIADASLLPNYVFLEPKFLTSLPLDQKKSTLLDALCQALESYLSVNATLESQKYAQKAAKIILTNYEAYLNNDEKANAKMLEAANLSGKAICISKTTAAHALSYKLTSLYHIPHGYAVSLCFPHIWLYMNENVKDNDQLKNIFHKINTFFKAKNYLETYQKFMEILAKLELKTTGIINEKDLDVLVNSVNIERLKNNPVPLDQKTIKKIYEKLL